MRESITDYHFRCEGKGCQKIFLGMKFKKWIYEYSVYGT